MKRIAISFVVAVAVVLGLPALVAMAAFGNPNAIIPTVLYWPMFVTDELGLTRCGDANLISEKFTCLQTGLLIDALLYVTAVLVCSYVVHRAFFHRDQRY